MEQYLTIDDPEQLAQYLTTHQPQGFLLNELTCQMMEKFPDDVSMLRPLVSHVDFASFFVNIFHNSLLFRLLPSMTVDYLSLLLELGVDVNERNSISKDSLLIAACKSSNVKIVKLLLDKEANPNQVDENGDTALYHAVSRKSVDLVTLLLNSGANPNIRGYSTPLLKAVAIWNPLLVKLLLEAGADGKVKDKKYNDIFDHLLIRRRKYSSKVVAIANLLVFYQVPVKNWVVSSICKHYMIYESEVGIVRELLTVFQPAVDRSLSFIEVFISIYPKAKSLFEHN